MNLVEIRRQQGHFLQQGLKKAFCLRAGDAAFRRTQGFHLQLGSHVPPEFVLFRGIEGIHHLHAFIRRIPQGEADAVPHLPGRKQGQLQVAQILPYPAHLLHLSIPHKEHRRRITEARRLHHGQLVNPLKGHPVQGHFQVILLPGNVAVQVALLLNGQVQPPPKLRHVLRPHGQPGGLFMSAVADEQILAAGQHGVNVHPGDGAAAAHRRIPLTAQHNGGIVPLFAQLSGGQADHAAVPALPHDHQHPVVAEVGFPAHHVRRLGGHVVLDALPLLVILLQAQCQRLCPGGILRHQQFHPDGGLLHASSGVNARGKPEGNLVAGHGQGHRTEGHQCLQSRPSGALHPCHAFPDDDPVFVNQGYHVCHGGQGGDLQLILDAGHAQQCLAHLQCHPCSAQPPEGIIPQQGIQHRIRLGKRFCQLVVIGNNHLHAQQLCQPNLLQVGYAAVHGNKQFVLFRYLPHGLFVQPVALAMAAGDAEIRLAAHGVQGFQHDAGSADPVHVVIPVDKDGHLIRHRLPDDGHGLVHALHQHGIVQPGQGRVQEGFSLIRGIDAPAKHQSAEPQGIISYLVGRIPAPLHEFNHDGDSSRNVIARGQLLCQKLPLALSPKSS